MQLMAERRMISKSLLMDNKFLSLSNDTKALYIYLLSFADDDGIVKRSMMIDSVLRVDDENYSALEKNGLIIPDHNDQIKVITDWNSLHVHTGYKMLENTDLKLSVFQHFFILVSY